MYSAASSCNCKWVWAYGDVLHIINYSLHFVRASKGNTKAQHNIFLFYSPHQVITPPVSSLKSTALNRTVPFETNDRRKCPWRKSWDGWSDNLIPSMILIWHIFSEIRSCYIKIFNFKTSIAANPKVMLMVTLDELIVTVATEHCHHFHT